MAARIGKSVARALRPLGARGVAVDAKCVRYSKHGYPGTALKMETVKLDSAALQPNQIFIRMLAAPITPTDLSQVAGFGGASASFPRVGGNEGVGIVEAVGSSVAGLAKGDVVVASTAGQGTWSTHVIGDAAAWTKLDTAPSAQFPVEIAAVSVAAPAAAKLMLGKANLSADDVVVQNLAFSTVGQALVQYAAQHMLKTVNVMRKRNDWGNSVYHLQGLGATIVVDEQFAATPALPKLLADLKPAALGLNGTGGAAAAAVGRALGNGASLITYGNMSGQPLCVPTSWFTGKGLSLSGFNLSAELQALGKEKKDALVRASAADLASGKLKLLVAREPFADFSAALTRTYTSSERKVVLTF